MLKRCAIIFFSLCFFQECCFANNKLLATTPIYPSKVVAVYPHDTTSFTEGLVYYHGYLYESTGLEGQSKLRKIDLLTGKIIKQINLSPKYFAEGIAILENKIFQLTYQSHLAFVYDINNFKLKNNLPYDGEGWGLTTDGKQLIMSDGTATITFRDPQTFKITRSITVHDQKGDVNNVNELEFIDNKIYANIWLTDLIAIISPVDGKIIAWIDLSTLDKQPATLRMQNVLNGIAYDTNRKLILVTGKNWPYIYAIRFSRGKN